jgi:hypothetical protein
MVFGSTGRRIMKRFVIIGEDDYHIKTIPISIRRIILEDIKFIRRKARNKGNVIKKYAEMLKEFKKGNINKAIILVDQDNNCIKEDAEKLKKQLVGKKYNFEIKFHIIEKEIETWLLADHEAISKVAGKNISMIRGILEEVNNPKEILIRLLREKKIYTPEVAVKIANEADIGVIENRCIGFKRFRDSVLDC